MTSAQPSSLELRSIEVLIDHCEVLRRIACNVLPGELFVVLGGADAGKSTLLRAVAGLDPVAAGEIWLDDCNITRRAAHRRPVALLLQNYPLWSHLSVDRNVGFALRQQRRSRAEIRAIVRRELAFVGLDEFHRHLPWQLSPGQRQRVALARTLAAGARVNLLDEPFSAQGARQRGRLLRGLRRQQQHSGTTTLLTTQDSVEALRVADRIAVIHDGELQQVGTPSELYDAPRNRCVAEHIGSANLIDGEIEYVGDQALFRAENGVVIPLFDHRIGRAGTGATMFRPRGRHIVRASEAPFGVLIHFTVHVQQVEFLGDTLRYEVDFAGRTRWMDLARGSGQPLAIGLDPARIRVLEH